MRVTIMMCILFSICSMSPMVSSGECLKVGIVGEFSNYTNGYHRGFGGETYDGASLASKYLKTKNDNICFDLVKIDTNNKYYAIDKAINENAKKGVHFFFGLNDFASMVSAIPALEKTRSFAISQTSSFSKDIKTDRVVTFFPEVEYITNSISKYLIKKGMKTLSIIYIPENLYSVRTYTEMLKEYKNAGGTVNGVYQIISDHIDLSKFLNVAKTHGMNNIFLPVTDVNAARIIIQCHHAGISAFFIGSDSWGTYSPFIEKIAKRVFGEKNIHALVPVFYDYSFENRRNREFIKHYKISHTGNPTDIEAFSYDSIFILHKMIATCGYIKVLNDPIYCLRSITPFETTAGEIKRLYGNTILRKMKFKNLYLG